MNGLVTIKYPSFRVVPGDIPARRLPVNLLPEPEGRAEPSGGGNMIDRPFNQDEEEVVQTGGGETADSLGMSEGTVNPGAEDLGVDVDD